MTEKELNLSELPEEVTEEGLKIYGPAQDLLALHYEEYCRRI